MDMKLELIAIPVSDVDRAKAFYVRAGFNADQDHRVSDDRVDWSYLRRRSWAEGLSKAAVSKLVGQGDALSTESRYVATVLPKAVFREVRNKRPISAAAVVTAFGFTAAGYVRGKLPGATAHVRLPASDGD